MKSLFELYREHEGKVSDKWAIYLAEYDRIFSGYRGISVNMLEIGVQNGGSLEIWSKYFPEAKKLIGCDINPDCLKLRYEDPRVRVVVSDANTDEAEAQLLSHASDYDLIIDDGSHTSSDIAKTFARYFRHLSHGGVFVAEDLHCSYWREFEGGLYYPYSSIAFFKRLADIVNYEHWGVCKSREQLLVGFSEEFSINFSETDLMSVHSVEFFNSVCVVRKRPLADNILGERVIAGQQELVVSGHPELTGSFSVSNAQDENSWSAMDRAPDEEWNGLVEALRDKDAQSDALRKSIADLEQSIAEREAQIFTLVAGMESMRASKSWRITAPLRFVGQLVRKYGL